MRACRAGGGQICWSDRGVLYSARRVPVQVWRDSSAAACRGAGCDRSHVARPHTPASDLLVALCARPVHRLAMTAMLESQRGLSDLSLLARSQLWATPFCFRSLAPHWE